jgi:hypothetical protein
MEYSHVVVLALIFVAWCTCINSLSMSVMWGFNHWGGGGGGV